MESEGLEGDSMYTAAFQRMQTTTYQGQLQVGISRHMCELLASVGPIPLSSIKEDTKLPDALRFGCF